MGEEALIEQGGQAVFGYLFKKLQRLDGKNTWETTDEVIREGMRRQFVGIVTQFAPLPVLAWITANPEAAKGLASGEMVAVPAVPTEAMCDAGWIDKEDVSPREIWGGMLDAASLPAPSGKSAGRDVMQRSTDLEQYALGLVAEEAGEVLQLVGNSLRFGIDSPRNDGTTARALLPAELGDLMAAIYYLADRGLVNMSDVSVAFQKKTAKLNNPDAVDNLGRRLAP